MHAEGFAPAILRGLDPISKAAHPIFQKRTVDEPGPDIERLDHFAAQPPKSPGFVCVHDEVIIALEQPAIEINDATHEFHCKEADAAIVEQIDSRRPAADLEHRIVAEMGIAVDHPVTTERPPPCREHGCAEEIARCEIVILMREQSVAVEPIESKEAAGGELGPYPRHANLLDIGKHRAVKRGVPGFTAVVELF